MEVCWATEWDEMWSFVGSKAHPRWTWYLIEKATGVIIAWQNGRRKDEILRQLVASVAHLPLYICYTDHWGAYQRVFPETYLHAIGKDQTWRIERKNLNFRTHLKRLNRRTICFSKSEQIHDNVIGMYIERYYYDNGLFSATANR